MSDAFPPTIIVRSPRENPRKCSVLPLRGRADILFFTYPVDRALELGGYLRLAADGPVLTAGDASAGILLLDGSWNRASTMNKAFAHVPPRSLVGYQTAYPRVSKRGTDPAHGLASVEALYIAYRILGRSTEGLLAHYKWAEEFCGRNGFAEGFTDSR
jgi:pre-rRNA-processing protein TSR3